MKRKMLNIEAKTLFDQFGDISQLEIEVPVKVGFRILQNVQNLNTALMPYAKELDRIIGLYSKDGVSVNEDDDPVIYKKAMGLVNELNAIEIEVEIEEIDISDLKFFKVPMKDMAALKFITKEDGTDDDAEK